MRFRPDEADRGRRDREEVRADRHRADDQQRVAVDDAVAPDDPGHRHEREVAADEARVGPGDPDDVGPDEARVGPAPGQLADDLDPGHGDVRRGDGQALELVEDVVDGVVRDVGLQHRAPGPHRADHADLRGSGQLVHPRGHARHEPGLTEDPQVEHPVPACPGGLLRASPDVSDVIPRSAPDPDHLHRVMRSPGP